MAFVTLSKKEERCSKRSKRDLHSSNRPDGGLTDDRCDDGPHCTYEGLGLVPKMLVGPAEYELVPM